MLRRQIVRKRLSNIFDGQGKRAFKAISIRRTNAQLTFVWTAGEIQVGAPKRERRPEVLVSTKTESETHTIAQDRGDRELTAITVISVFQIRFRECAFRKTKLLTG
jgi:hypothetical protein